MYAYIRIRIWKHAMRAKYYLFLHTSFGLINFESAFIFDTYCRPDYRIVADCHVRYAPPCLRHFFDRDSVFSCRSNYGPLAAGGHPQEREALVSVSPNGK